MKLENKVKSLRFRLFGILTISIIFIIVLLVIINNIVLETFYIYSKTKTAREISYDINKFYNGIFQYNIAPELRQVETKENVNILIENSLGEIIYCANKDMVSYKNEIDNINSSKTVYSSENTVIKRKDGNDSFLMLISKMDNGYLTYIRIPLMPIKESVKISGRTLMIVGIIMAILSGIVASIISKKFTKRIVSLNNITSKMSKLDFSEKFEEADMDDEIDELGKNINLMSEKLETTIGQLRKNNNELEKGIEEKSKIDDMRKSFISDVSHELKTPIALIQGYAEGLLENVNTDEESRKFYAEVIIDESNKMDKMVKELLDLMKLEQKERIFNDTEFNLTYLIKEELRRQTKVIKEKKITIDFDETKKVKVFADEEYIQKIVNNYLTNAIKHCKTKEKEKKIVIRTEKQKNNKIRLFVYNTGDKIESDVIDKIWNRFYKEDSSRNREDGGTGIGLSIVKAIMNNYKNEYGVKNYKNGVEFFCDINQKAK